MADNSLPQDVARVVLFQLVERNGTTLHLKSGARYSTPYTGKVLTSPITKAEICIVEYEGTKISLEATNYIMGGRRLSTRGLK